MADAAGATTTVNNGTRLSVVHRTAFHYAAPVTCSVNTLHLEPQDFPFQKTISCFIRVIPAVRLRRFTDLFKNTTHEFEIPDSHVKLEIESRLKVLNQPLILTEMSRAATMAEIAQSSTLEWIWQYQQTSTRVSKTPEIWKTAVDVTYSIQSVFQRASLIMEWIHREFRYESGVTSVHTHLEEVFGLRHGVCQDFTHVMIGMCRSIGMAARYVSGYLYNGPQGALLGSQASHAWCEVYIPHAGWVGFDPTNNTLADERFVRIAVGRDYDDVKPVEGSYRGTARCHMEVHVEVAKI